MASLKKLWVEESVAPTAYGRLVQGTFAAMSLDPTLPGVTAQRERPARYRTPLPWQLPAREGCATRARAALVECPFLEPEIAPRERRRPGGRP